jgi:hypothetical protein
MNISWTPTLCVHPKLCRIQGSTFHLEKTSPMTTVDGDCAAFSRSVELMLTFYPINSVKRSQTQRKEMIPEGLFHRQYKPDDSEAV